MNASSHIHKGALYSAAHASHGLASVIAGQFLLSLAKLQIITRETGTLAFSNPWQQGPFLQPAPLGPSVVWPLAARCPDAHAGLPSGFSPSAIFLRPGLGHT